MTAVKKFDRSKSKLEVGQVTCCTAVVCEVRVLTFMSRGKQTAQDIT